MWCFLADTQSILTAIPSTFTTELPTARLPSPEAAFAAFSIGWMPMEVASEGDCRTHKTTLRFSRLSFGALAVSSAANL
jgi:hypothetical protein